MKRFHTYFVVIAIYCFSAVLSSQAFAASDLEEGVKELAQQISKNMTTGNKKKIAIIEFSDLDGKITAFGQFLAEELITQLFMISSGQFEVVERRQLMKVLNEQKLSMTGLLDAKAMESVGKILGIEAIVTGSIADLGNDIKVNARLIGIDTAKVFAVASTKIPKVGTVAKLIEKEAASAQFFTPPSSASSQRSVQPEKQKEVRGQGPKAAANIFHESRLVRIEFDRVRVLSNGKIIVFLNYINKTKDDLLYAKLKGRRGKSNTFLIDDKGNEYKLVDANGFSGNGFQFSPGIKAPALITFEGEDHEFKKGFSSFTLTSEQNITAHRGGFKDEGIFLILRSINPGG